MRNVPGRKRDVADCQWIAELHEHGLLRPSFIPTAAVAELRAQTRYRKKLIEQRTAEGQRLSKTLEDAGIKIDSVASRLLGKSGRAMIEALIAGERDPGRLADLARGLLRRKTEEPQLACDGRVTAAHAQMCRLHLDAHDHFTAKVAELDTLIAAAAAPFEAIIARLQTIPGVGRRTAEVIVAETGGDMARFPTAARLGRAGTRRQRVRRQAQEGPHPQGRPAPARRHGRSGLGHRPHRHPARSPVPPPGPPLRQGQREEGRGRRRAHPAEHRWAVMRYDGDYIDAGTDYYERRDQRNREHLARHHQQALARLGYQVTITPPEDGNPPPAPPATPSATPHQAA